jgi:hypothetical protein
MERLSINLISRHGLFLLTALLALAFSGCTTVPQDIETPSGPVRGDLFEPMQVLGVARRLTRTGNRPNAATQFNETIDINIPVGTETIVPALEGWMVGFGHAEPENIGEVDSFTWHTDDHNFGLAGVSIKVIDINAPNTRVTPPTQTAQIKVFIHLSDKAPDDRWFGVVRYSLMYLGRQPPP